MAIEIVRQSRDATVRPTELCPICCEAVAATLTMETYAGAFHSACYCEACPSCVARWVDSQLGECVRALQLRVRCFGCRKNMPQAVVLAVSPAAERLAEQLEQREALQRNELFPESMQVNCIRFGCVGIGYTGFERVQCFVCGEQWVAPGAAVHSGEAPASLIGGIWRAITGGPGEPALRWVSLELSNWDHISALIVVCLRSACASPCPHNRVFG